MQHWNSLRVVPKDALKEIKGGRLNGKSDINPQWRYETMTKEFGPCGIGWKYEIVNTWTQQAEKQVMVFVQVNLYIKENDQWSAPIPGIGGDFLLESEKNGLHANDEAYKMATTDALGVAMKMVGVAADVYRGLANDSKYGREKHEQSQPNKQQPTSFSDAQKAVAEQRQAEKQADRAANALVNEGQRKALFAKCNKEGISNEDLHMMLKWKYGIDTVNALTIPNFSEFMNNMQKHWQEFVAEQSKAG